MARHGEARQSGWFYLTHWSEHMGTTPTAWDGIRPKQPERQTVTVWVEHHDPEPKTITVRVIDHGPSESAPKG